MGSASTLVSTSNQVTNGAGVAVAAVLLNLIAHARGGAALSVPDFQLAFVGVAILGTIATMIFAGLPADAGASIARPAPVSS
jgi:hypothetical protein